MKHSLSNTIILAYLLFFSANLLAQVPLSTKNKKAIDLYGKARYTFESDNRISLLKQAIKKDKKFVEAYWMLADEYNRINKPDDAIHLLKEIDNDKFDNKGITEIRIAELYYNDAKYDSALAKIKSLNDGGLVRQQMALTEKYQNAIDLKNHPKPFHPVNLTKVNTRFDDYFPSITPDGKRISTTVLETVIGTEYSGKQEDIYQSIKKDGDWQYSRPLPPPINTDGNEGSQSFSADGRYMFFVSCNNRNNIGSCDMYYSIREGKRWSPPINMGEPANSPYWESNPVLSPTGDELYFTSNRPGGYGKQDIWKCKVTILDNGVLKFSDPENLGSVINTSGGEFSPFIAADNKTLYFASDGHMGMGRNDIFLSRKNANGQWTKPENIGYPINTNGDESGFVVDASGTKAYFASDKIENNGQGLDIYEIDLPKDVRPTPMSYVEGKAFDADTHRPINAHITIFDQKTNTKQSESVADRNDGTFTAYLPTKGQYGINADKDGYLFYSDTISTTNDSIFVAMKRIVKGNAITLQNLFFGFNSSEILPESNAQLERLYRFLLKNGNLKIELVGHTDNIGSSDYNMDLSLRRAQAVRQVLIQKGISATRIMATGKGSTQPVASNDTDENRQKNRRVEMMIK